MTSLWINQYQNWNAFYTPNISHTLRIQNIFLLHAVWYEDRAIQLLKFSMSQEVKKGPFAALTFESSKNFMLTHFQKLMWFYFIVTKDRLLGKVWGGNFFPMRNTLDRSYRDLLLIISWLVISLTLCVGNSYSSRFKTLSLRTLFVH